jgi:hypothetical protein
MIAKSLIELIELLKNGTIAVIETTQHGGERYGSIVSVRPSHKYPIMVEFDDQFDEYYMEDGFIDQTCYREISIV